MKQISADILLIRHYQADDSEKLSEIFTDAIMAIEDSFYTPSQKHAWIGNHSAQSWQERFSKTLPYVAAINNKTAGFIEFGMDGRIGMIDCLYIDPNYQNQGIGRALLNRVLDIARLNHLQQIQVYASHVAKPLFEQHGFDIVRSNCVIKNEVQLENWLMVWRQNENC